MLTERRIQQDVVIWYRSNYCLNHHTPRCLILAVPNEGNFRLSQTGAYPGASDLIVFHFYHDPIISAPAMKVLFVEVKSETGKQTERQEKFEKLIKKMNFILSYHVVKSLPEFKKLIVSLSHASRTKIPPPRP